MSFCRWSSDNWKCDVYAYEANNGFVVHVAGARYAGDIPGVDMSDPNWIVAHRAQMAFIEATELVEINGPFDGETFVYSTLAEMRAGLIEIKKAGYHIPDFVFENIDEELAQ